MSYIHAAAGKKQLVLPFFLQSVDFMCIAVHETNLSLPFLLKSVHFMCMVVLETNDRGDKGGGGWGACCEIETFLDDIEILG